MSLLMKVDLPLNAYWQGAPKPLLHMIDLFHVSRHTVLFLWHTVCPDSRDGQVYDGIVITKWHCACMCVRWMEDGVI